MTADLTWKDKARCRGVDPDLFFPGRWEHATEAKEVCAGCPVREECLRYALDERIQHGVWGGMSERQRRRLRRDRRAA